MFMIMHSVFKIDINLDEHNIHIYIKILMKSYKKDLFEASRNNYSNYDNQSGDTFNHSKKFDGKYVYYQNMY